MRFIIVLPSLFRMRVTFYALTKSCAVYTRNPPHGLKNFQIVGFRNYSEILP